MKYRFTFFVRKRQLFKVREGEGVRWKLTLLEHRFEDHWRIPGANAQCFHFRVFLGELGQISPWEIWICHCWCLLTFGFPLYHQVSYLHLSITKSPEGTVFSPIEDADVVDSRFLKVGRESRSHPRTPRDWSKHQILCSMIKSQHWSVSNPRALIRLSIS